VTVPACSKCNGEKAKLDLVLRDYLVFDIVGSQHPVAKALFEGKIFRALMRNQSELARVVRFRGQMRPLYSRGGLYLGDFPMAEFDHQPIKQAIAYIYRGLYWSARGKRIPDDYRVNIWRVDLLRTKETWQEFKQSPHMYELYMGRSVFGFIMKAATEDLFTTLSILGFYDGVLIVVSTESPTEEDLVIQAQGRRVRPGCGGWTPDSYASIA
jgi:hypothetical protein